jgi:restriction system protein
MTSAFSAFACKMAGRSFNGSFVVSLCDGPWQRDAGRCARLNQMRRVIVSILFGLLALNAFGQIAPDIAKGTPAEEVIRLHGWPKGKSVTNGRESWLYDRFQVLFQQGKVVSVSYIAVTEAEPFKLAPSATVPDPGTLKQAPSATAVPTPASPRPSTPSPRRTRSVPDADFMVAPKKAERQEPASPTGLSTIWIVSGLSAVGLLLGLLILSVNRRDAAKRLSDDVLEQKGREPFRPRKWEDEVAERLRRANDSKTPPIIKTAPASGPPADTSTTAERHAPGTPEIAGELTLELLRSLEWKRFEQIVALYYGETGVSAKCTCNGPDGGVDVKLHRNGEERPYCYIQCKAWGAEKVPITKMREFLGVMANDRISEGIFVTTSDFWPDARAFAEANGIAALTANDFLCSFAALPATARRRIIGEVTSGDYTTPSCPKCDIKAMSRERKRDGVKFWSCRCGWTMTARAEDSA